MRAGKAPPSPWYFTMPQGYPGPGIYPQPQMTFQNNRTVALHGLGATTSANVGLGLAIAVGGGILLASLFTVLVKA